MKGRHWIAIGGSALVLGFLWLVLRSSEPKRVRTTTAAAAPSAAASRANRPAGSATAQAEPAARREAVVEKIITVLATPITFYGKVIDQNAAPVSDASIHYGTIDKFDANGSSYEGKSDSNGEFSISRINGAVLTVGVSKAGYYNIHGKSDAAFAYGVGPDSTRKLSPTKDKPAIFTLQKMGETKALIHVSSRQIDIPKDGRPVNVDLTTGRAGGGDLQLAAWIADPTRRGFEWRYQLSVDGGGLTERLGQFDFEAPTTDYKPSVEVAMSANSPQWLSNVRKDYFVKLPDGRYGRALITLYPGRRNFVVIESYVNPTPGSRNLEFDATKVVGSK